MLPQEALGQTGPLQAKHYKHGFTLMEALEGNSLKKAWKLYMLSKKLGQLSSQDQYPPRRPPRRGLKDDHVVHLPPPLPRNKNI